MTPHPTMAAPEFRERFMCKLTTPTTCYSAPREIGPEEPWMAFMATENHTLEIHLNDKDMEDIHPSFVEHSIPIPTGIPRRMAKKLICVGYTQKEGWEALVLLDTSKSQEEESQQDDTVTVTTEGHRPLRRRVSSGNVSVGGSSTEGTASLSSTSSVPAAVSIDNTTTNRSTNTGNAPALKKLEEGDDDEEENEDHPQPIARLILQHATSRRRYTKPLDFRPLSPCITILDENAIGVWLGSSDDSKLRLFRSDTIAQGLVEVPLNPSQDKDATIFQSPVMAVDCLSLPTQGAHVEEGELANINNNKGVVAVACQDGTVRFLGYEWLWKDSTLNCQSEYTVVVDGPIVCIQLVAKNNTWEAVFGSLCGYVARVIKKDEQQWEGPYMVAEGFGFQSQEDSVLALHSWDNKVALGTYSGRCLLYGQDGGDLPFWDCQLPDPIHGICHVPTKESTCLLVTTSRSIHVFEEVPKIYHPALAKRKLELLLSRQQQQNKTNATIKPAADVSYKESEEAKVDSGPVPPPAGVSSGTIAEVETTSQPAKPD